MARVQGIKEKVHLPIYDALEIKAPKASALTATTSTELEDETFGKQTSDSRLFRFFVDVQGKSKLETNLQSAGVLPSLNTFEVRALRVVTSTVRPLPVGAPTLTSFSETLATEFADEFVFNSVTSLLVGEKVMIEMPTFWFPSGSGIFVNNGGLASATASHGLPDPLATFSFAEAVFIESQQSFRVEILFPNEVPEKVKNAFGPLHVWVVLDGFLTRDAQ